MKITAWRLSVPVIAASLFLTGCKDEEQTQKIKELEAEAAVHVSDIENLSKNLQETEAQRNKFRTDLEQAQRDASRAKDQLAEAQRQLESMRKAELAQQESARATAQRNPVEDSKKAIIQRLAAVWLIEGDQGNCHGFAAEADGKTWLYFPAGSLKGSSKLAVRDTAGAAVTKFGELQVAADANLARLEIKQDVATRFTVATKAELGENPRLFVASPLPEGGPIKLDDCQPGTVTPADIEFNSYNATEANGYPVFNAETGALIAITVPNQTAAAGLWDVQAPAQGGMSHSSRLDRSIDWKPSTIGALLAERRKIDELNRLSKLIYAAASVNPSPTGLTMKSTVGEGSLSPRQVFDENKALPAVQEMLKLIETLSAQKVRVSESDIKRQFASVAGQFSNASHKAAAELRALKVSPNSRQDAENALKWNDEADKKLAATLSGGGH